MHQFDLEGKGIKLIQQENLLAVFSDNPLKVVGSAFHNGGGIRETHVILNIEVPHGYGDIKLHLDPEALIVDSARKLNIKGDFVAMVTAACVEKFAMASKHQASIGVSVIATAADDEGHTCDHAESAGEEINAKVVENGTINIIVLIDGNPTDASLVSSMVTATEAKTAAMLQLDIRSVYSGEAATGTITDAIVCAKTGVGEKILFGGPASKLGQLVGFCTRQAVKAAIMKGRECSPIRSLTERLRAKHLSVEKLAQELSQIKSLGTKDELTQKLSDMIACKPLYASIILAASKLDEDVENGLIPPQLGDIDDLSKRFAERVSGCKTETQDFDEEELAQVDLPPFLKYALLDLIRSADL